MNLEQEILSIKRTVRQLQEQLSRQRQAETKWVPASRVMKITGWDKAEMQAARRDGLVAFKELKEKGRKMYKYNLATLPKRFDKNKKDEPAKQDTN